MTLEEETLQKLLDENPQEQTYRIMLADHLEDIGDSRADGYRAMAAIDFYLTERLEEGWEIGHRANKNEYHKVRADCRLSVYWLHLIPDANSDTSKKYDYQQVSYYWRYLNKPRREAEDIIAVAFAALTDEQKLEAVTLDTVGV